MTAQDPPVVGTEVTVSCPVHDRNGVLTDPSTITFQTKSGTTQHVSTATYDVVGGTGDPTGTIVRLGAGTFEASFVGTEHGLWEVEFKTTGPIVLVKRTVIAFQSSAFSTA